MPSGGLRLLSDDCEGMVDYGDRPSRPTSNIAGYPLNHLAAFAYEVAAAWLLFALAAKRRMTAADR
jgi:hypothetical protein